MIAFGLYHLVKPVHCLSCDHYFAGATLDLTENKPPVCPCCSSTKLKLTLWENLTITPKAELLDGEGITFVEEASKGLGS